MYTIIVRKNIVSIDHSIGCFYGSVCLFVQINTFPRKNIQKGIDKRKKKRYNMRVALREADTAREVRQAREKGLEKVFKKFRKRS